jgi:hypothetical protein
MILRKEDRTEQLFLVKGRKDELPKGIHYPYLYIDYYDYSP